MFCDQFFGNREGVALTPKQERFVEEYLVDLNATAAARRAGYSVKTAEVQGPRLLGNVRVAAAIEQARAKQSQRMEVKADDIVRELKRVAFGDPRKVMEWGPGGVKLRNSAELTDDEAAFVSEASETTTQHGGSIRLKMNDKIRALELLGKHLGIFTDNLNVGGGIVKLEIVEERVRSNAKVDSGPRVE